MSTNLPTVTVTYRGKTTGPVPADGKAIVDAVAALSKDELKAGDVVRLQGDKRFWRVEKLRPDLYCDVCLISLCEPQVRTEVNRKWVTIVPA